ncbi:WhiB family transcriptional regulator [Streptomyces sp. NPDC059255]|uniref:WhiB family transcriptional regulator n=1 Tax=Streptomyces sp. NPDC059255 TaxID=3346793 RepID=UPI0036CE6CDC
MSGSRTGVPQPPTFIAADDRIPFPRTERPLRCRTEPVLFSIEDIHNTDEDRNVRERALATVRRACSGCPIVKGCLKWALANPDLTKAGVWAATTAPERKELRHKLAERLGDDWVAVVVEQDRRRRERQRTAHVKPPTVRERALARLELELIPTRPEPYEPWKEPMTPARQAQNTAVLKAALSTKAVA